MLCHPTPGVEDATLPALPRREALTGAGPREDASQAGRIEFEETRRKYLEKIKGNDPDPFHALIASPASWFIAARWNCSDTVTGVDAIIAQTTIMTAAGHARRRVSAPADSSTG